MFDPLSAIATIIGAGSSLFGQSQTNRQAAQNAALNVNMQQQYAAHGLEWKAKDARAAEADTGINALTLLGAPTSSFSSVAGGSDAGAGVAAAGQNIQRALLANTPQAQKMADLEAKLLEAKIANVNSDTTRTMAIASNLATTHAAAGSPAGVPLPPSDPRGPIIPLVQRAWDPRTNEVVWIPSEKAASPLQTLGASNINAALAGRSISEGLAGFPGSGISWGIPDWLTGLRPDVLRNIDAQSMQRMY